MSYEIGSLSLSLSLSLYRCIALAIAVSIFSFFPSTPVFAAQATVTPPGKDGGGGRPDVDPKTKPPVDPKLRGWTDTKTTSGTTFAMSGGSGGAASNPLLGGRSAGSAKVGNSGAASYSIPIMVPPGTNGVQPNLALSYNSQSQENEILGVHWQLSGLPTIERCPRTIAQDGVRGNVNYDTNDKFCMEGARLIVVSGTYGANDSEYRTEVDSFVKIKAFGSAGNGPAYFTVTSKDGNFMEFGGNASSDAGRIEAQGKSSVRVWALNRMNDVKGNYFSVTYQEDNANGDYRPDRIDYTINTGLTATRSVQFVYENYGTRPDAYPMYVANSVIRSMVRLTNVRTYVNTSTLVKDYRISYEPGEATKRSRLTQVLECSDLNPAQINVNCLPANTFSWQEGGSLFTTPQNWQSYACGVTCSGWTVGDFNGDGKSDFVYRNDSNIWVYLAKASGSGFEQAQDWGDYLCGTYCGLEMVGDFNGDGKSDFLYKNDSALRVYLANSTGTGFEQPTTWGTYVCGTTCSAHFVGDFNGDGKNDFMYRNDNKIRVYLAKATGTGFENPLDWGDYACGTYCSAELVGDFNGDGKTDFMYRNDSNIRVYLANTNGTGFEAPQTWGTYLCGTSCRAELVGDFNGDGRADFMYVDSGTIKVYISTGTIFLNFQNWGSHVCGTWCRGDQTGDFNGDGKIDFLYVDSGTIKVYLSTGTTFDPAAQSWGSYACGTYCDTELVGDFNGDGKSDFVYRNDSSLVGYYANSPFPDLITTISNGLGGTNTLVYKPITDNSVYATDNGTSYQATYPIWNTASHSTSSPT